MTIKSKKLILCVGLLLSLSFGNILTVNANEPMLINESVSNYARTNSSLDGLGVEENTTYTNNGNSGGSGSLSEQDQANKDSASAVSGLFQNTGVTEEATTQANTFLLPLANAINIVSAFILGFTSLGIFLVTALDLLYIAFPPMRNMLNPQASGGNSFGGGQESTSIRWISDEAIACAGGTSSSPMGGGGMMGPMGSPMGGMGSPQGGGAKSMIVSYLKKRTVFLVVFAICVILFTSTVFTDLGLRLGMLILSWITGMNANIPM